MLSKDQKEEYRGLFEQNGLRLRVRYEYQDGMIEGMTSNPSNYDTAVICRPTHLFLFPIKKRVGTYTLGSNIIKIDENSEDTEKITLPLIQGVAKSLEEKLGFKIKIEVL